MIRLNITLPNDLGERLRKVKNKSRFIAEALREKMEREKRIEIERLLKEGYRATAQEDKEIVEDWEKADLKEWE
ncbi:MAG: hypothetical protein PVH84_02475 [Candidatus Aminicenantes bacterium]|jgi:metal-responsive CopG/Arc/MetJ family transcriptional regulator